VCTSMGGDGRGVSRLGDEVRGLRSTRHLGGEKANLRIWGKDRGYNQSNSPSDLGERRTGSKIHLPYRLTEANRRNLPIRQPPQIRGLLKDSL